MTKTIKEARKRLCLTQAQMAEKMGMTQPQLAKIETGIEGRKETSGHKATIKLLLENQELKALTKT